MSARAENLLTFALAGACVVLLAAAWWPRWTVRADAPVRIGGDEVTVAVDGAVARPGSYTLPWGARVADLLERAGGATPAAERALIVPTRPLTDGERVHVPAAAAPDGDRRVSLNRATRAELDTLPGIGPALARRIEEARPFSRVADLRSVRGIGPVTMERLRPRVTL